MTTYQTSVNETPKEFGMNPKKFILWLLIGSIIMMFGGLTSAYMVKQGDGNWYVFDLPSIFYTSTVVLFISSITMHAALVFAKKNMVNQMKGAVIVTLLLGFSFLYLQILGYGELVNIDVYFVGNPSGSFVYVLSGVHFLHIVSGIIFLLFLLRAAFTYKVHSKQLNMIEMCTTYWHFLDGLWIFLFLFILLYR